MSVWVVLAACALAVIAAACVKALGSPGYRSVAAVRAWVWGGAALLVSFWHLPVIVAVLGESGDSFYTLTGVQRAVLILISTCLIVALCWISDRKSTWILESNRIRRQTMLSADLAVCFVLFTIAHGLSTQVYYQLYRLYHPGLPQQWVVQSLFDVRQSLEFFLMRSIEGTSDLLPALTLWLLLIATIVRHLTPLSNGANRARPMVVGATAGVLYLIWVFAV